MSARAKESLERRESALPAARRRRPRRPQRVEIKPSKAELARRLNLAAKCKRELKRARAKAEAAERAAHWAWEACMCVPSRSQMLVR